MKWRAVKKQIKHGQERSGYADGRGGPLVYFYRDEVDGPFRYKVCTARPKVEKSKDIFGSIARGWRFVYSPWSERFGVWLGLPKYMRKR